MERDDQVREEIIQSAQLLFQQFGLKKTTMDEIAAACGKAKSTLYHYFVSKEEVFKVVLDEELKSLRKFVKEKVDQKKSVKDKLITYFLEFHKETLNRLNVYRIVRHEILNGNTTQEQFNRMMSFEKSYIARLMEDGHDTGELHLDKKDIPLFAEILLAAFFGIVRYSVESDREFDQEKFELTTRTFIPKLLI